MLEGKYSLRNLLFIFLALLVLGYVCWLNTYAKQYGKAVFEIEVPENNLVRIPSLDSGVYRVKLVGDGKKCKLTKGSSCILFKNIVDNKCLVKINGENILGQVSVCGRGRGDGYISTMDLMEFNLEDKRSDILIDVSALGNSDSYRPMLKITKEPPNDFAKWIHPDYGLISIFVFMAYLFAAIFN